MIRVRNMTGWSAPAELLGRSLYSVQLGWTDQAGAPQRGWFNTAGTEKSQWRRHGDMTDTALYCEGVA